MTEKALANHALSERTRKNLLEAMHGEAFAFAKYRLYARQARKNGRMELADLFERTAEQEFMEHFAEEAELFGLVKDDDQDIHDAIAGESYEVERMYKNFAEEASIDGDHETAHRFEEIRRDEAEHLAAFESALTRLQNVERFERRPDGKARDF